MKDDSKTKSELLEELKDLRKFLSLSVPMSAPPGFSVSKFCAIVGILTGTTPYKTKLRQTEKCKELSLQRSSLY